MTGDAPQPGQTPRNEGEPWGYADPNTAWWRVEEERDEAEAMADAVAARPRHPRRRPATTTPANAMGPQPAHRGGEAAFAPEALDAHAAGVQDVARQLDPPPAALVEAEQEARIETIEATAAAAAIADAADTRPVVERDHDRRPRERHQPTQTAEGYDVSTADHRSGEDRAEPAGDNASDLPDLAHRPDGVPEVMVLPEPQRNRPTVALDRGPLPDRPPSGLSRPGEASRERLENSPFWLTDEERAAADAASPAPEVRQLLPGASGPGEGRRSQPPAGRPRRPVAGLTALVALALVAAFFSWVSAEPFWLAVGHGDRGVATVGVCTGSGVTQRCAGAFAAGDGRYRVERVALVGVGPDARDPGAVAPARMVSPDSRQAYVGATGWMVHLRWVLGFVLVVMCGYGIAGLTGTRQLETASARRGAVLMSLAGPILLLLGFLAATY
ncbi:MAG TPA: hypothetical protein VFR35_04775 [Actinoplanes sp.]|nr:hypothetical protein [Actinoplanes sp.]